MVVKVLALQSTGLIQFSRRGLPKILKTVSTDFQLHARHEKGNAEKIR